MILDAKGAIGLLRLVVFEKGADHTYSRVPGSFGPVCVNFYDGEPSCIVGHVLANLGVSAEKAAEMEVSHNVSVVNVARNLKRCGYEWEIGEDAVDLLEEAQTLQDNGHTWGEALANAEISFSLL